MLQRSPRRLLGGAAARRLQQAPLRVRSTAAAALDDTVLSRPAEWDSAKPFSAVPGPRPLPVIGNLWRFLPVIGTFSNMKDVTDFFEMIQKTYGPITKMSGIPGRPEVVMINDPDDIATVFRNEGTWPFRRGSDCIDFYFKKIRTEYPLSLVVSQGKEWQDFRTSVNQVMMQPRNVKQYVEPIDEVSREFVDRMRKIRDEKMQLPDNFSDEISKWALESITYVALDAKLGMLKDLQPDSEAARMIEAVHVVFDSMYKLDFLPSPWKIIPTPAYRRFIKHMDYFTEVSAKYVNLAMERLKTMAPAADEDRNYSVLENLLIRTGDPKRAVTMALDMLLAGIDTTATVVATMLYQLSTNPEKQKKLQEELDRVIVDPSKPLTNEQLEAMKYLRACIKETMRVMPILLGNSRTPSKDLVLQGYQIPKGTFITMAARSLQRDERFFPRAEEFIPERWLPGGEDLKGKHPFSFLPFGFGPRMCVGRRFAELEIESLVARIFKNFSVEWNLPEPKTEFQVIFRFVDPTKFTIKDRM